MEAYEISPALDYHKEEEFRKSPHRDICWVTDTNALFQTAQQMLAALRGQVATQISRLEAWCLIYTSWKVSGAKSKWATGVERHHRQHASVS